MFSQKGNNEMYEIEVADHDNEERREAKEIVNKALHGYGSEVPDNCDNENAAGLFHKRNSRDS